MSNWKVVKTNEAQHVMTRYGEVHNSIHLCNILIVDTIFCSPADFYQRYMNNLQRRVNIGKKNLLCSFIDVIPGRFRLLQKKNMQSMHPKQYIAERGQSCCIGMHPKSKGNMCKWFCHTLLIFQVELVFPIVSKIKMVWW